MSPWQALAALAAPPPPLSLEERQGQWLKACIARNSNTEFGRQYAFGAIKSVGDFLRKVPLCEYKDLRPAIERIANGAPDVLFAGRPVAFERTGGSSGGAKLIPYTADSLLDFRRALLRWLHDAVRRYRLTAGTAYWALSPATRQAECTAGGVPIGLPDGAYFGSEAGELFASLSAVPVELAAETDVAAWQRETLYWLVRRHDLALVSVWSPSFFTALLDALPQHGGALLARLSLDDAPAADRLRRWLSTGDARLLWPDLRLISCWSDASSRPYFQRLRALLPQAAFQPKGLLSTEAVVTIPNEADRPVLAVDSGFYEFIDDDESVRCAWQLQQDECYEVVLTSAGGLYRYRTGDRVRCMGHADHLPVLRFVGRNGLASDLVGEKLTDEFVAGCLEGAPGFNVLLPKTDPPGYLLVHQGDSSPDLESIDAALCRNPQYAYARRMNQLRPLGELVVPDALERFTAHAVSSGRRLGDVKVPSLCLQDIWAETNRKQAP